MDNKYDWLEKKTPRSVEQLRLWNENPRLNPEEKHITLADFTEDLIAEDNEKKHFFDLLKSISKGFIPADPIIVWKDDSSKKFYVAEGNRRVLAIKLLNDPNKAPKSIRAYIRTLAKDWTTLDKIKVNVAPSLDDAEWYICQRNSMSTLQQRWSRIQQQRWIENLYDKYGEDIPLLLSKSSMSQSELESAIRNLRFIDLIKSPEVKNALTEQQFNDATSYKFPITIIERFFSSSVVKDAWGIDFDGVKILLKNKKDFLSAYAELIRNIVDKETDIDIDTRTITTNLKEILDKLPKVDISISDPFTMGKESVSPSSPDTNDDAEDKQNKKDKNVLKGDPNRPKLILPIYTLKTSDFRLDGIFTELQKLSVNRYKNAVAASIRIFLDLAVYNWLQTEGLIDELKKNKSKDMRDIPLKQRLDFVASKINKSNKKCSSIISRLLNEKTDFSLDVLNGYQHSKESAYLDKAFLNRFWDFLFPLFETLLDIKEN